MILCAALWGTAFPGIKFVYAHWGEATGSDGGSFSMQLVFAGVRFAIAGLLLFPFSKDPFGKLPAGAWKQLMVIALTQTFGQYLFFYAGLAVSSGVLASLLVSTGSFWWVILAPLMLKTPKPTAKHWLLLGVSAIGITLAVHKPGGGAGNPILGAALFLGASLCGAIALIFVGRLTRKIDSVKATALSLFCGGLLLTLVGTGGIRQFVEVIDVSTGVMTLYLAFVSATAFGLWNRLAQLFPVNLLAGYRFLIPLSGVILSALLIPGETIGLGAAIGGGMVLSALVWLNRVPND